jgi:hypothetical protein
MRKVQSARNHPFCTSPFDLVIWLMAHLGHWQSRDIGGIGCSLNSLNQGIF